MTGIKKNGRIRTGYCHPDLRPLTPFVPIETYEGFFDDLFGKKKKAPAKPVGTKVIGAPNYELAAKLKAEEVAAENRPRNMVIVAVIGAAVILGAMMLMPKRGKK